MTGRKAFILGLLLTTLARGADVVDLSTLGPDNVWRCANSTITSSKDKTGTTVWTWKIGSGEGFLWINEDSPIHAQLQNFDRLVYDVNFADGQIELFWPRTMGVLKPPLDKMFCEWNLFYFTHPHKTWLTYQQVLDDPSWFAHWASQIPPEIQLDRTHLMGFACLAKGESVTVELRNVRLIRDCIGVEKPYLTTPIGWPVAESIEGKTRYRTPYFVKNLTASSQNVSAKITSQHKLFAIKTDPPQATIQANQTQRFDLLATQIADAPPLTEETAVVEFVPQSDPARSYRTETYCTIPLPKNAHRMIAISLRDQVELSLHRHPSSDPDADFWMSVDLSNQTEIPNGIGHDLVVGLPVTCPQCKQGHLQLTHTWLQVKCDHCGHVETHTRAADATWIGTWSEIHGLGPDPRSLGRAYLATKEEKFAKQAIALLKLLSTKYATLTWHNANRPEGWNHAEPASPDAQTVGASARWGNSPTYGTNFMVQRLAALNDMIVDSPSWTDADRKQVHEGFWIPVATELTKIVPGISNMNDIINRDLILAGFATNDANMIFRGTLHPVGLLARMKDITPDGFSDEGSALNYHLAGMREWFPSIELLINTQLNFPDITDRAIAALKMPLIRAGLNGVTYCTGNSGAAWFNVPLDHEMFQLADRIFPENLWPHDRHYETTPHLFRDAGWAILRTGDTIDSQVEVNLDYGRSHGHGDLDRMNLGLQAFGVPLSADPGSSYNYNTNAKEGPAAATLTSPLAANTVIVDGKDQLRGSATLIQWDPTPTLQRITAKTTGVYPGVTWQRSVALTHNIAIIVDDLRSAETHRYESAWHHYGPVTISDPTDPISFPDSPYKELLNPKSIMTTASVHADWIYQKIHLHLTQPAEKDQLTYTAQTGACWENVKGLPIDSLFTRREGKSTRFITVLEPYRSAPTLSNVSITHQNNQALVHLKLTTGESLMVPFADAD